jgi:hypothetical protein
VRRAVVVAEGEREEAGKIRLDVIAVFERPTEIFAQTHPELVKAVPVLR